MKITIDLELCTGCGTCEAICPEVFELDDEGFARVIHGADCEAADCCEEAADSCPEGAIAIE